MNLSKLSDPVKKIIHLVNIVDFKAGSEHAIAQNITLESLKRAKIYAENQGLEIKLLSAQYPEDHTRIPEWIEATEDLEFSCLEYPELLDNRKLPSLADIIQRGLDAAVDADALIYSNIDIAVQKEIYVNVKNELDQGAESLSITRRTIPQEFDSPEQLDAMYQSKGEAHPGDDFFVFSKACFPKMSLRPVFVGVCWFDKILLLNAAAYGRPFKKIRDQCWTFHLGDDRTWSTDRLHLISEYNRKYLVELVEEIEAKQGYAPRNKLFWPHVRSVYELIGFEVKKNIGDHIQEFVDSIIKKFKSKVKNLLVK
ncbi:hypothetical protein Lepto7376_0850 [[Leptolyngbya] sp. PCC 7376]|uniref:hypothetical protein n=1 Tax=[Leptolyngbya] sp. PCC 7376 TaxID=111781 RepID=UPI00029F2ABB|nr:hypothetical protein [[Leptolyngbya] sp. PCC 7376]AFY37245.1 hypothetical protein Lepto7376_0850 [[Leptolyngbya] sp. PCC 7376]